METTEVAVLSTHNFMSGRIANMLQFPIAPTDSFDIRVANGKSLTCQVRFDNVSINIQGIMFKLTLYALPLIGLDVVLRVQWLP